ncbi:Predicted enzyme with a TIM-barrel fold [Candidatus Ornithobacterium hominis]|uniref:Pyridoxal phosphate homeostasis protein n=1 Tax=Candidatus Ornithobacterium hominis TaxID=2497989 RepID=A0A383TVF6_9FLAO|nr:YggS family pyridoxal phosphate-dependent enzyme [Candidatus Ornithobacterium hominis]MCT7904769.1 YggS family pyridoxal phosphate-dependent enzyme [Candidatus Ornithobacterium hominis]CAI9429162.1 Pyridoxal phosphate homeostasis protein [Candidatus Ornithobacterium hominis]SZD71535.1 Predicted enzyme with a TIM-barrel fold [Candidatus Ornithobacterium hominis]
MSIEKKYQKIKDSLPKDVTLVAVSKTKPIEDIEKLYAIGVRDFGENKVQELTEKAKQLPKDIRWHMIGHLQSNKVKYIANFVHLIHSADRQSLIKEINKRGEQEKRIIEVLIQVKIADEDSKFGMNFQKAEDWLRKLGNYPFVRPVGMMGMATNTDDDEKIQNEFAELRLFFEAQQKKYPQLKILSMGMSSDYEIALQEKANMLRVGSKIFGERNYDE